jgi:hypothetical protein
MIPPNALKKHTQHSTCASFRKCSDGSYARRSTHSTHHSISIAEKGVARTRRIMHEMSNRNQNLNTRKTALQAETERPASMLSGIYLHCFGQLL